MLIEWTDRRKLYHDVEMIVCISPFIHFLLFPGNVVIMKKCLPEYHCDWIFDDGYGAPNTVSI